MKKSYLTIPLFVIVIFAVGYFYFRGKSEEIERARNEQIVRAEREAKVKREEDRRRQAAEARRLYDEFMKRKEERDNKRREREVAERTLQDELQRATTDRTVAERQLRDLNENIRSEEKQRGEFEKQVQQLQQERVFLQDFSGRVQTTATQFTGLLDRIAALEAQQRQAAQAAVQQQGRN